MKGDIPTARLGCGLVVSRSQVGLREEAFDQTHAELRWVSLLGSNAGFNTHSLLPACFLL